LFFKSVILFQRFKKCKFLAPKGGNKKKYFARGISKEFFTGVKQNSPILQRVKTYIFTLFSIVKHPKLREKKTI
jgi:hypothetical protein